MLSSVCHVTAIPFKPINQSNKRSRQSTYNPTTYLTIHRINNSTIDRTIDLTINRTINLTINRTINLTINRIINLTNRTINRTINLKINSDILFPYSRTTLLPH